MADRPILFSAPMIRALLDGRKTQTRRILKPQPTINSAGLLVWDHGADFIQGTPDDIAAGQRVKVGDRLWVRETWQGLTCGDFRPTKHEPCEVRYFATDPCADLDGEARGYPWRPSIFMPRFASRLTLIVTEVCVERLQDCSEADAIAEGAPLDPDHHDTTQDGSNQHMVRVNAWTRISPVAWYHRLWNEINGHGAWEANPWVVAYTFTVERKNIDEVANA